MHRSYLLLLVTVGLFLAGCRTGQQPQTRVTPALPCHGLLKRVTQLDLNDNHAVKSWSACAESIHQHPSPPVGIAFTDAETGQEVHFDGTYKIETYKTSQ